MWDCVQLHLSEEFQEIFYLANCATSFQMILNLLWNLCLQHQIWICLNRILLTLKLLSLPLILVLSMSRVLLSTYLRLINGGNEAYCTCAKVFNILKLWSLALKLTNCVLLRTKVAGQAQDKDNYSRSRHQGRTNLPPCSALQRTSKCPQVNWGNHYILRSASLVGGEALWLSARWLEGPGERVLDLDSSG